MEDKTTLGLPPAGAEPFYHEKRRRDMPRIQLHGKTDIGRSRKNNEDSFATVPELSLGIVADGMGGAACGEVASEVTVRTIVGALQEAREEAPRPDVLRDAIQLANEKVRAMANNQVECTGMGSTVVLALYEDELLHVANVGDSLAYLWREGELRQLSYDQNLGNELRMNLGLTDEQLNSYPHRHVLTMAIGTSEELSVRLHEQGLQDGDLVLLCSDGLYGPAGEAGIREVLQQDLSLEAAADELIRRANASGGPDNITVVLMRYAK